MLEGTSASASQSADREEIERFGRLAERWWDPHGPMRALHRFNPARLSLIRNQAATAFARDIRAKAPFAGLTLLDIGCGGGLVSEPMARLGFRVTGIDAAARNIAVAQAHAREHRLEIDYRTASVESLAASGVQYDVVLNLEVVEHVNDPEAFLRNSVALMKPTGLMMIATINRTAKAFAFAVLGAEYVLRWLPRGTHDWRRFLRPAELAAMLERAGARVVDCEGLAYDPLYDCWQVTRDLDVNYMAAVKRAV
jgi:2-polyprenyl-6-hydroxyphenyl methylase/3-demethylubiquinone-9 3-methyltransferase